MSNNVIEVELNKSPAKAPRVAKRLESSPKTLFPSTPEKLQQRQERAAEVRKERVAKAHAEVELAKKRAHEKPTRVATEGTEGTETATEGGN